MDTNGEEDALGMPGSEEVDHAALVRLKRLRWLAAVAWLAWFGCVAVVWRIAHWSVMHPHFLPLVGLAVVHLVAAFLGVCVGLKGVIRGPGRVRVAIWTGLSTVPVVLSAVFIGLCVLIAAERDIPGWLRSFVSPRPLAECVTAGAAPILDGLARISHPHRFTGEKSVMLYRGDCSPQEEVAAMDRHIEQMEELLGRQCQEKVHWIRGPMLGVVHGFGFQGLAFGSPVDAQGDSNELGVLDRHEVAHFVAEHLAGLDADPPGFLAEGWAESQSSSRPGRLARRAFQRRRHGPIPSLSDLAGPDYYHHPKWENYVLGGAFVDFLLRHSGGEKFFELYSTCQEETFAEDCRRILGLDLDELDRLYWADVSRQVAEERRKEERADCARFLVPLPAVGYVPGDLVPVFMDVDAAEKAEPASDAAAREAFFAEYPGALRKLIDAYREVRMTGRGHGLEPTQDGPWERDYSVSYAQDDQRHHGQFETERERNVLLVTPEQSCLLSKGPGDDAYQVLESDNHQAHYLGPLLWYNLYLPRPYAFPIVDFNHGVTIADWMASPDFVIRDFGAVHQAAERLVQVRFESRDGPSIRHEGWFLLAPDRGWAIREFELRYFFEDAPSRKFHCGLTYDDDHKFPPVVKQASFRVESKEGKVCLSGHTDIEQVSFGPIAPGEFRLDAYPIKAPPSTWMVQGAVAAGVVVVLAILFVVVLWQRRWTRGRARGEITTKSAKKHEEGGVEGA